MFTYSLSKTKNHEIQLVFLHGWGTDSGSLLPLAQLFTEQFDVYLVDFAGFGKSKQPDSVWTTKDYATDLDSFITTLPLKKTVLIGHSFGGRVAVQYAANYSDKINGVALIGCAGFPLPKSLLKKVYLFGLSLIPRKIKDLKIVQKYAKGSADYNASSGIMRKILKQVVNENLTPQAQKIKVPTLLLYGQNDTAAPPAFGEKYHQLISGSQLIIFPNNDHFSLLFNSRFLTYQKINQFLREEV